MRGGIFCATEPIVGIKAKFCRVVARVGQAGLANGKVVGKRRRKPRLSSDAAVAEPITAEAITAMDVVTATAVLNDIGEKQILAWT